MAAACFWACAVFMVATAAAWLRTRSWLSYWVIAFLGTGMALLCAEAVARRWWLLAVPVGAVAAFEAVLGPQVARLRRRQRAAEKALADLRTPRYRVPGEDSRG